MRSIILGLLLLLACGGVDESHLSDFEDEYEDEESVDMTISNRPKTPLFPPSRAVFTPAVSRPLVDDFSLRAARHQHKQAPGTPVIANIPLRSHPMWTSNNELGIETGYQPDGDGYQTILKLGEWGPPQLWTISLGIAFDINLIPLSGDAQFSVDALIKYGSGGVTQEIEVDWANGVTLSVPMNAVNVIARYSDFSTKNNTPPDLRLRVNLAPGGEVQGYATKSNVVSVSVADGATIPIPPFARRLSVQRGGGATAGAWSANMIYTFIGSASAGDIGGFDGAEFLANFAGVGVPIPPSARAVAIDNNTAGSEAVLLIFHLSA